MSLKEQQRVSLIQFLYPFMEDVLTFDVFIDVDASLKLAEENCLVDTDSRNAAFVELRESILNLLQLNKVDISSRMDTFFEEGYAQRVAIAQEAVDCIDAVHNAYLVMRAEFNAEKSVIDSEFEDTIVAMMVIDRLKAAIVSLSWVECVETLMKLCDADKKMPTMNF